MFQIFIDSDGPMCDFDKALAKSNLQTDDFKYLPGLYLWLDETLGSRLAIEELKAYDDEDIFRIWILTKTPSGSPYAYTEKVLWYREHYPWLEDRIILSHDKSLIGCKDDFLLDDRPHKANAEKFRGNFVKFDVKSPRESWVQFVTSVLEFSTKYYANEQ